MKTWTRFLVIVFFPLPLALADDAPPHKPAAEFRTQAVKRGSVVATVTATGTLEPEEVVDVGAQVAGTIERFGADPQDNNKTVDYGTHVDEGIRDKFWQTRLKRRRPTRKAGVPRNLYLAWEKFIPRIGQSRKAWRVRFLGGLCWPAEDDRLSWSMPGRHVVASGRYLGTVTCFPDGSKSLWHFSLFQVF